MRRSVKAFTMHPRADNAILIGLWEQDNKVAVSARVKDSDGILLPDDTIDCVFGIHPLTALAEMLIQTQSIGARCCGVFTNSEVLLHWFFTYRMKCPSASAPNSATVKTAFNYTPKDAQWDYIPPAKSTHPAWDIVRILMSYTQAGVWEIQAMPKTEKIWLDHYGKS